LNQLTEIDGEDEDEKKYETDESKERRVEELKVIIQSTHQIKLLHTTSLTLAGA